MRDIFWNNRDLRSRRKLLSFGDVLLLLLLFLGAMNVINRDDYCYYMAFAVCILTRKKVFLSKKIIPILAFSISLLLFWPSAQVSITRMLATFLYPICFFVGYNLLAKIEADRDRERILLILITFLALGTWVHMVLNARINIGTEIGRSTKDFWIGDILSATGQACLGVLPVGISVTVLFSDARLRYKLLAGAALVVVMWYNLILAGRMLVMLLLIVAAVAFSFRFLTKGRGKVSLLLGMLVLAAAVMYLYSSNAFGVRELVVRSNLYQRFFGEYAQEVADDSRMRYKLGYLKHLVSYPFGGGHIRGLVGSYAHDLYLDTYDEGGVFAFLAICVVSVQSIKTVFVLLRENFCSLFTKLLVLCVMMCIHTAFWIEPILAGVDWLIVMFCAIYGAMCCLVEQEA